MFNIKTNEHIFTNYSVLIQLTLNVKAVKTVVTHIFMLKQAYIFYSVM